MWLPVLLLAGAGVSIYLAKRYADENAPSEPSTHEPEELEQPPSPPPGVINMSLSEAQDFYGDVPGNELIFVWFIAVSVSDSARLLADGKRFSTKKDAETYFSALVKFFTKTNGYWTCPKGLVSIQMGGYSAADDPVLFKSTQWSTCDPNTLGASAATTYPPAQYSLAAKPVYVVSFDISGATQMSQSFFVRTDAEAEMYYRLLRAYFEQPAIYKAYTFPMGTIFLTKYGTPPSQSRHSLWNQDGEYTSM